MVIVKKIGKILGLLVALLLAVLFTLYFLYNEKLPEGLASKEADSLALKMLQAVNHEAYKNTRFLEWTFNGQHHYLWDKQEGWVDVSWEDIEVQLNLQDPEKSTVLINGLKVVNPKKSEITEKAVGYFNNDSFWLVAPHKVFDSGTERKLVTLSNGDKALLVTYTSGGSTPGDSYLWLLEESGLPKAYKMWVGIIPVGGLETKWKAWKTTESGALLPTHHRLLFLDMNMGEVRAWN